MTTFTNRGETAGYGNTGGGLNNAGGGGGITGRHHHQGGPTGTGMGMGNGQNYPNNQHDFASGGGTYNDPGFNNTASTGGQYGGGQFGGPGQQGGGGGVGGEQFGGPGHMHQGTGGGQFGGPGQGAGGQYGGGGPGGVTGGGLGAPTGGGGGGGVTGTSDRAYQHTGVGNDGNNMGSQAPVGASAGEKEFVGKVERLAGTALCSSSLKAKGAEKEREAQALKAQAAELNQAEGLETEAAMRRQRAVAHGADPHHLHGKGHHGGTRQV